VTRCWRFSGFARHEQFFYDLGAEKVWFCILRRSQHTFPWSFFLGDFFPRFFLAIFPVFWWKEGVRKESRRKKERKERKEGRKERKKEKKERKKGRKERKERKIDR
jgi:hypothetical protein